MPSTKVMRMRSSPGGDGDGRLVRLEPGGGGPLAGSAPPQDSRAKPARARPRNDRKGGRMVVSKNL